MVNSQDLAIKKQQPKSISQNQLINDLLPQPVWYHFENLSCIPRASRNEDAVANYVMSVAKAHNLSARIDKVGNVIVEKPASDARYASAPTIVLQSHLDMVTEKNPDVTHDFSKDPIQFVRKGHYLAANGTTLGADNGIGVALSLAVMESDAIVHGPLEFIFTVCEESGFDGARGLTPDSIKGRILINLDAEELGSIYVGCAGGGDVVAHVPVQFEDASCPSKVYKLSITGLKGGHSGVDIDKGRVNALKLLGNMLSTCHIHKARVASIDGGNKRNAIPRYAQAIVAITDEHEQSFVDAVQTQANALIQQFKEVEPNISITIDLHEQNQYQLMSHHDVEKLCTLLSNIPHGVIKMSPDIAALVQTSTNLARVSTQNNSIVFETSQRSLVEDEKHGITHTVATLFEQVGATATRGHGYPGWQPTMTSPTLQQATQTFERVLGKKPEIKAIHAGLECGQIGKQIPGMDMISFGPTIHDAHSPTEHIDTTAVQPTWEFLVALLGDLAAKQ